jgi:undecaprenyl pyrophosphate phosphatase UppP
VAYEKDQHPTARLARLLSIWTMIAVTLVVLVIYGAYFDDFSETELVQLSFIWISLIGWGIGGLLLAYKGIGPSIGIGLVVALAFFLALQTFYVLIWPSL